MQDPTLVELVDRRHVILCVGSGGVGKTTTTAALAIAAARRGKRVLALTIDPAKRLVKSLGLSTAPKEPQRILWERISVSGEPERGTLSVMVLDSKAVFDDLVMRHASTPVAREKIFNNPLYHVLATKLAGTGEYMAMEKLLELKDKGEFDLIVLDTPPTRNALDFLNAPERLLRALDSSAMRWFVEAFSNQKRFSFNVVGKGVALVLRGIGRITSSAFLRDLAELIVDLNDLFGGFRERALRVSDAFRKPDFAYLLVTTTEQAAIDEARFFAQYLLSQGMTPDGLVVNRVHAPLAPDLAEPLIAELTAQNVAVGHDAVSRFREVLEDERATAMRDRQRIETVRSLAPQKHLIVVPALPGSVHDPVGLVTIARILCPE